MIRDQSSLVYVVGLPRSGTWLMYECLRIHPDIYVPAGMSHYLNRAPKGHNGYKKDIRTIRAEWRAIAPPHVLYWADKANDSYGWGKALKAFDARFIFVTRDPFSTVYSLARRINPDFQDADIIEETFYYYNFKRKMWKFGIRHSDRCHFVSFEDLVKETKWALAGVWKFLGLRQLSDEELNAGIENVPYGATNDQFAPGRKGISSEPIARWVQGFRDRHLDLVRRSLNNRMNVVFDIWKCAIPIKRKITLTLKLLYLRMH